MAFTKKAAKKAPPSRASYARKKAEEQEQEVQEEVQEDYAEDQEEQEQEQERAPRQAPAPRRNFGGGQSPRGNSGERKALRLTGLFAGKREGLFTGRLRDEDAENLKALIEEAQSQGQQISFFLWENQGNPQFSLTANIAMPKQFGGGGRRGGFNRNSGRW